MPRYDQPIDPQVDCDYSISASNYATFEIVFLTLTDEDRIMVALLGLEVTDSDSESVLCKYKNHHLYPLRSNAPPFNLTRVWGVYREGRLPAERVTEPPTYHISMQSALEYIDAKVAGTPRDVVVFE